MTILTAIESVKRRSVLVQVSFLITVLFGARLHLADLCKNFFSVEQRSISFLFKSHLDSRLRCLLLNTFILDVDITVVTGKCNVSTIVRMNLNIRLLTSVTICRIRTLKNS